MSRFSPCSFLVVLVLCLFPSGLFGQSPASHSGQEQYAKVLKLLAEKDYGNAIVASRAMIERFPGYEHAYQKLVEAAKKQGTLSQAEEYFQSSFPFNPAASYGLGLTLQQMNEPLPAIESFQKCLAAQPEFAPAYRALVDAYLSLKRPREAETYLKQISVRFPNNQVIHYAMGYLSYREREFEASLAALELVTGVNPKSSLLADTHLLRAQIYNSMGRLPQSLEACQNLLLCVDQQDAECFGTALVFTGAIRWKIANYDQATEELNRALEYVRSTNNKPLEVSALSHLGATYWRQDDYLKALTHWQNSLRVARDSGINVPEGRLLGDIGLAHREIGNLDEALTYLQEALSLARQANDNSNEIVNNLNIGEIYIRQKRYNEAKSSVDQAIHIAQQLHNPAQESFGLLDLAYVYTETGSHAEALQALENALSLARTTGNLKIVGEVLNALGTLRLKRGDLSPGMPIQEAITDFQRALYIGETTRMPKITWQAHTGLAAAYEKLGQFEDADQHYRQAMKTMEDVRSKLEGEEERANFLEDKINVYHNRVNLLLKLHQAAPAREYDKEAFETVERARARSFLDLLIGANATIEQEISPELRSRKQEISYSLSRTQTELLQELAKKTSDQKKIQELDREIAERKEELRNWRQQVSFRHPRIADLLAPTPINLRQTQILLGADQVLLEYSLGENQSFLFAVSKQNYLAIQLPARSVIASNITPLLKTLRDVSTQEFDVFAQNAAVLYQQLIQPALPLLSGKKEIIIAADGILNYLPFAVLLRSPISSAQVPFTELDPRQFPYLIMDFAITYVPSASVLASLAARQNQTLPATEQFLGFADPDYGAPFSRPGNTLTYRFIPENLMVERLRKSRDEVTLISKFFAPKQVQLFFGKDASENNAKDSSNLSRYRILHFSVHGWLDDQRPQLSGLILSLPQIGLEQPKESRPGRKKTTGLSPSRSAPAVSLQNDGVLQVNEVFGLKLNADLVTLSACETGLGKVVNGEGMIGLTRAFLYAGASSVIVSLWKVEETSTGKLMVQFYKNLMSKTQGKAEALRAAQLDFIRKGNHPASWASFILVGNP